MNDPAVDAAQRALADMPNLLESCESQPILNALVMDVDAAAAREALKPIREFIDTHHGQSSVTDDLLDNLARLVYSAEELS